MESPCNHYSPGQRPRDRATGPRGQNGRGAHGATGLVATDVRTERPTARTAMKSPCNRNSPGPSPRDRATGPRGHTAAGPPGPRGEWPRTWGRNAAPHARLWRARAITVVPGSARGTGPPGPGAELARGLGQGQGAQEAGGPGAHPEARYERTCNTRGPRWNVGPGPGPRGRAGPGARPRPGAKGPRRLGGGRGRTQKHEIRGRALQGSQVERGTGPRAPGPSWPGGQARALGQGAQGTGGTEAHPEALNKGTCNTKGPGAPGRVAPDVGTERRPTRTAKKSTCYDNSPGQYARDRATGPRGQDSRGAPRGPGPNGHGRGEGTPPHAHGYGEPVRG